MQRAPTIEDFVANPVGRYIVGANHIVWCHSASLCGAVNWGRPSEADVRRLVAAWNFSLHPALAGGWSVIMDNRQLERASLGALTIVLSGLKDIVPKWHGVVRRQAIVIPPPPIGILLAGIAPLVGVFYPLRLFRQLGDAIAWVDHPDLAAAAAEATALVDEARGISPVLRRLRAILDETIAGATLQGSAAALGRPRRTLQRELADAGTSFRRELDLARVRAASSLLENSDDKIEVIARRVGFGSASRLGTMFRRTLGETPGEHRRRLTSC
jgi:AraC-like DNA-binding protein